MTEAILSTNTLPSPLRERFSTKKIAVRNHKDGVIIMPFKDISTHRGIAKGSSFTTETLRTYRSSEQAMEDMDLPT